MSRGLSWYVKSIVTATLPIRNSPCGMPHWGWLEMRHVFLPCFQASWQIQATMLAVSLLVDFTKSLGNKAQ